MVLVLVAEEDGIDRRAAVEIDAPRRKHVEPVAARIVAEAIAEQRVEQNRGAAAGKLPALMAEEGHFEHRRCPTVSEFNPILLCPARPCRCRDRNSRNSPSADS